MDLVSRPHLIEALDGTLRRPHKLILVSAPAGFGKTTLVAEWVRRANQTVAWVSLDRDDNNPVIFWRSLVAALQTSNPALGQMVRAALNAPEPPLLEPLVTALINDLDGARQPFILVLDDYHYIDCGAIHASINFMLDRLPPAVRLVIVTRVDPPLTLSRYRARAQLTEVRAVELRFALQETATFLNGVNKLNLSDEDISFLENRTEGWIVGLHLAALSLREQPDRHAFVTAFAGDDRYIVDYLLEEVLQQQPALVQAFLLQTSILDRLCGPLCEAVTGMPDAHTMLRQLEQANLFISPLDTRRTWYRYHPLFADLLRRRLGTAETSVQRLEFHRRASVWYEHEGFIPEAVSQAITAGNYDRAAVLLERHALTRFFGGETLLVHDWIKALPEDVIRAHPLLCVIYANTSVHASSFHHRSLEQAEYWLQVADQALAESEGAASGPPADGLTRSFMALSRAYVALWRHDPPQTVISLAQRALDSLPPADAVEVDPNFIRFRSGLTVNLGISYLALGNEEAASRVFDQARQIGGICSDFLNVYAAAALQSNMLRRRGRLREAAALCREVLDQRGDLPVPAAGGVYVALGHILLEWNELDAADSALTWGLELSRLAPLDETQLRGHVALAHLHLARGEVLLAFKMLRALEMLPGLKQVMPNAGSYVEARRAHLWLMQGNLDAASKWAEGRSLSPSMADGDGYESLTLARILIAQHSGSIDTLVPLFSPWIESAEAAGRIELAIELGLVHALALQAQGSVDAGLLALQHALVLAEPGGYVRRFVNEGQAMRRLLQAVRTEDSRYVSRLLGAFAPETPPERVGADVLVEPLSPREYQVLRLLAAGASNAEIAHTLVITVNTAKKHVINILRKMDVTTRAKAVTRARDLGLLD